MLLEEARGGVTTYLEAPSGPPGAGEWQTSPLRSGRASSLGWTRRCEHHLVLHSVSCVIAHTEAPGALYCADAASLPALRAAFFPSPGQHGQVLSCEHWSRVPPAHAGPTRPVRRCAHCLLGGWCTPLRVCCSLQTAFASRHALTTPCRHPTIAPAEDCYPAEEVSTRVACRCAAANCLRSTLPSAATTRS